MDIEKWLKNIKVFENDNLIAYQDLYTEKIKIEFKPNCDKKVLKMWEQLNMPIRRSYEIRNRTKSKSKRF